MPTVFVNPERCIGCRQCELACAVEHSSSREVWSAFLEVPSPHARVHVAPGPDGTSFPNLCRHCDPAPCMQICPTAAISRHPSTDAVVVDDARCIGCAMCAVVCPFDVLTFHATPTGPPGVAVAVKCDGCTDRRLRGVEPACAEVCKVDALTFGELNELVADGRLRETAAVLAAASSDPTPTPAAGYLDAWRSWTSVARLIRGAPGHGTNGNGTNGNGRRPNAKGGTR